MERRTFLITGCASGIGRNLADALVAAGNRVCATDIDLETLQIHVEAQAWPTERLELARLDVTDAQQWRAVVERARHRFGSIDVLCNVAGYLLPAWVRDVEVPSIDRHIDVNLKGVLYGMQAIMPHMIENKAGHIINIASMAALAPIPGLALYSASKYAVRAFSLAAAHELRPHGVKVTVVCPDAVRTPMLELQRDYEEAALTFSGPRVLEPEQVTDTIMGEVLRKAPLEVFLPSRRGWLARVADVFPEAGFTLAPLLRKRGRARQHGTPDE